jgi:hypothetical protein
MSRSTFLRLLVVALPLLLPPATARGEDWPQLEPAAQSLVRLDSLAGQLAAGIAQQVEERGLASDDSREEIAVATARSLHRATTCLKRRFFDGAEPEELVDRIVELDALAERVRSAGAKIGLYGYLREKLAAYLNERDRLKRLYGLDQR